MKAVPQDRFDLMGEFHNSIIQLIDSTELNLVEVLGVIEIIAGRLKTFLELTKGGKE